MPVALYFLGVERKRMRAKRAGRSSRNEGCGLAEGCVGWYEKICDERLLAGWRRE